MASNDEATQTLLQRAAAKDTAAITALMNQSRSRLRQMVSVRTDDRLAARVDPSDVVQETLFEATRRLEEYLHVLHAGLRIGLKQSSFLSRKWVVLV